MLAVEFSVTPPKQKEFRYGKVYTSEILISLVNEYASIIELATLLENRFIKLSYTEYQDLPNITWQAVKQIIHFKQKFKK